MIELASNGRIGSGAPWCGVDGSTIIYPKVSTCVTVTAVAGGKLIGAHLFRGNTKTDTDSDLSHLGELARGEGRVGAVYVVGMFQEWESAARNRTGYTVRGKSLLARLRSVFAYEGGILIYDASPLNEINLKAAKAGPMVNFSHRSDDSAPWNEIPALGFGAKFSKPAT